MTKDETLKLKPGTKIRKTQTREIYIFEEFVTFDGGPPLGSGPTVFAKLIDPDGRVGFI